MKLHFEELPPPDVSFLGSAENFFLTFRHLQRIEITCQSALGVAMEPMHSKSEVVLENYFPRKLVLLKQCHSNSLFPKANSCYQHRKLRSPPERNFYSCSGGSGTEPRSRVLGSPTSASLERTSPLQRGCRGDGASCGCGGALRLGLYYLTAQGAHRTHAKMVSGSKQ